MRHACDETLVMKNEGIKKVKKENAESIMVFVESGGGCSVPFKVQNMEKAGAQAVLVAGAITEEDEWFGYATTVLPYE